MRAVARPEARSIALARRLLGAAVMKQTRVTSPLACLPLGMAILAALAAAGCVPEGRGRWRPARNEGELVAAILIAPVAFVVAVAEASADASPPARVRPEPVEPRDDSGEPETASAWQRYDGLASAACEGCAAGDGPATVAVQRTRDAVLVQMDHRCTLWLDARSGGTGSVTFGGRGRPCIATLRGQTGRVFIHRAAAATAGRRMALEVTGTFVSDAAPQAGSPDAAVRADGVPVRFVFRGDRA